MQPDPAEGGYEEFDRGGWPWGLKFLVICVGSNNLKDMALEANIKTVEDKVWEVLANLDVILDKAAERKIITEMIIPPLC